MNIKVKLRRIGNSMGVILPADVITGYTKGDVITLDVITKDAEVGDVITPIGILANPKADDVITDNHAKFDTKTTKPQCKVYSRDCNSSVCSGIGQVGCRLTVKELAAMGLHPKPKIEKSNLAPDGFPIQHTNSMKVGYVPTS